MLRRDFLHLSLLASGATVLGSRGLAESGSASSAKLTIQPHRVGNAIEPTFTGLSYETAQLSDPDFFSGSNTELIGLVRRLGKAGVLRIGGNTSEYSYWNPNASSVKPESPHEPVGPDTGKKAAAPRTITPLAIRNLRDFIDATGWQLIYGLNMGTESAETAAAEAAYVSGVLGPKLVAFQLCNEPDLFSKNGLRQPGYNFEQFATEWQHFYEVITARVRTARFAGPDTAFNNEWLVPFADKFSHQVEFLSQHYYAEGPPTDPSMTIDRLLRPDPKLEAQFIGMKETVQRSGLPFRLAETNSCYSGGKQGVSDTFASALWAADLMYQLAAAGGEGINFHGGGYGWYTPIAGTREKGFTAHPIYHGMLLFAEAGAGHLVESSLETPPDAPLLNAYALRGESGVVKTAIFNKNQDRAIHLEIESGTHGDHATALHLSAPGIDATSGATFGGATVGASGAWKPTEKAPLSSKHGRVILEVPAGSAVLVTLGKS
jgi:Glycosyl hydrolase family 79 C-terminal beta domain/Glycosyl hydrolase family 79, N-terminal domain